MAKIIDVFRLSHNCLLAFSISSLLYSVLKVHASLRSKLVKFCKAKLVCKFRKAELGRVRETNSRASSTKQNLVEFASQTRVVGSNGLEPSTSRLSGARSNHLSYEPISVADPPTILAFGLPLLILSDLVEMNRIELSTPCLQGRCSPS